MSWKARHAGSPKYADNLTPGQVAQGLVDGFWEPTDEVMGPNDTEWVPFETHPNFAAVCEEIEPPPPPVHEDETTIDMNALIDVCLVLLIFFILTMTYQQLTKVMSAPQVSKTDKDDKREVKFVLDEEAKESTIIVDVTAEDGKPKVTLQGKPVELANPNRVVLEDVYNLMQKSGAGDTRTKLLLRTTPDVKHEDFMAVYDAADQAKIKEIIWERIE